VFHLYELTVAIAHNKATLVFIVFDDPLLFWNKRCECGSGANTLINVIFRPQYNNLRLDVDTYIWGLTTTLNAGGRTTNFPFNAATIRLSKAAVSNVSLLSESPKKVCKMLIFSDELNS